MKRAAVLLAAGVTVVASCAACRSADPSTSRTPHPSAPAMLAVQGAVTIVDPIGYADDSSVPDRLDTPGDSCHTISGYTDVSEGGSVIVADDGGHTLTLTPLSGGVVDADGGCRFTFTASVPAGRGFYSVAVGHRDPVKVTEAALPSVALTLGG